MSPVNSARRQYNFHYFAQALAPHRLRLLWANMLAVLATLMSVPVPLLLPLMVDEILLDRPGALVGFMSALFPTSWHSATLFIFSVALLTVLLRAINWFFVNHYSLIFYRLAKGIVYRIRQQLLWHFSRVSVAEYEQLGSGTVGARLVNDLQTLDSFLSQSISRFIVSLLSIIAVAIVLLIMHWPLALFLLFLNPVVIFFTAVIGKRIKELKRRENKSVEVFQQALDETLAAIRQFRIANRDQHYLRRITGFARQLRDDSLKFIWRSDKSSRLSFLIFLIGFDLFRAVGMLMVIFSDLSIGQMIAVFGYLWFMLAPLQEVLGIQYLWFAAKAALDRVNGLLAMQHEPHHTPHNNPFAGSETCGIEVRDLHLSYLSRPAVYDSARPALENGKSNSADAARFADNRQAQTVLCGVNLSVAAGDKVALVGASGGGKSTFIHTLMGLYPPDSGSILYDGVAIEDIGYITVRENVSCVLQNAALFNDSVRENLSLGMELDDERLWSALRIACLDDFIRRLPAGLNTLVGVQGVKFSGGQRQRLAIARALLSEPKILILDEATSAVDAVSEQAIYARLFEVFAGKTMLIVAHRLSAVRQADHIYVFEGGRVVEQGEHDNLIRERGLYHCLFSSQL